MDVVKEEYQLPVYLFHDGTNYKAYDFFGVHKIKEGTYAFRVWAPEAEAVSVVGDFNSWNPSTTAATVVASQTLSGNAQKYVATDLLKDGGYNYVNLWTMKMPIVYTEGSSPTQKALPLFSCGLLIQTLFRRYSSFANLLDGNMNNNVVAQTTLASFLRYYGSTTGSITYTNGASYGFYYANVAPTISSATAQSPTITLKTPSMSARCSTTYMSTANAALIDKTNTKLTYTCKVYRVRQDAYLQGFYRYLAARVAEMDS